MSYNKKLPWDTEIPQILKKKFKKWIKDISSIPIEILRPIANNKETITSAMQVFGEASILANSAAAYDVVSQPSAINQGLVASKSQISQRDMTIPRLQLVSTNMACNLITIKREVSFKNQNVRSVTSWTDSTVVLYYLNGQGSYNQIVRHRVNTILERDDINWQYLSPRENPADLGSRGS